VTPGRRFDLAAVDPDATVGAPGAKAETRRACKAMRQQLDDLQQRLYAEQTRGLLVVLQAMDSGGKDGTIRHVFRGVNPQGVRVASFKAPTDEELRHDFLWRIHRHTPAKGEIAIFNRSHYEDVLIARVHGLVPEPVWRARYAAINDFERSLIEAGTTIVKFWLHISADEQRRRLESRLAIERKRWKFNPEDIEERKRWPDYQAAAEEMLWRTSTKVAPWYVVPANHKWYRNWFVTRVVLDVLTKLDPAFPTKDITVTSIPDV
jgi:PPK2 family polyphosphate:nucleotide phosphotransferase